MFLSKVEGETICPCLMVWLKKFRVKRFVCCCLFGEWLILGSGYRWYLDTGITVSLILGSGYRWCLDTGIWVSLILGSGYRWYLDTGIWVSLILGLGICGYAWMTHPQNISSATFFFPPAKLTCILHPSTSAHPLQRAWRRNANASKPPLNWLYSSGRSLLAPHEEASTSFRSPRRSLGDTPWVLPLPPWGDSPSLPGHPISFELVSPSTCTTAQPAWWPHPHLSDLPWRRFAVSSPRRASCPPRGCSSASTPPLSHRRQEPCSASGSRFPALPPPWPQMWSLRKAASHHNQIWHVKPFGDDVGHGRHADLQNELARGIVVGDVASEGTEGGSKIITGIPTKICLRGFWLWVAGIPRRHCLFGAWTFSFTRSSKNLTFDG